MIADRSYILKWKSLIRRHHQRKARKTSSTSFSFLKRFENKKKALKAMKLEKRCNIMGGIKGNAIFAIQMLNII